MQIILIFTSTQAYKHTYEIDAYTLQSNHIANKEYRTTFTFMCFTKIKNNNLTLKFQASIQLKIWLDIIEREPLIRFDTALEQSNQVRKISGLTVAFNIDWINDVLI